MNKAKEEALKNIEAKINVLSSWLINGIPSRRDENGHQLLDEKDNKLLEYVPTSVRQFCGWDGSQNCEYVRKDLPAIRTLNNSTLVQHKRHRAQVEKLVDALKEKVRVQQQKTSSSEIKRFRMTQRELEINLHHALDENLLLRRDYKAVEKKYQDLLRSTRGHEQEFAKNYQDMEAEIERLKRQVSDLTQSLAKVRPLSSSTYVDK